MKAALQERSVVSYFPLHENNRPGDALEHPPYRLDGPSTPQGFTVTAGRESRASSVINYMVLAHGLLSLRYTQHNSDQLHSFYHAINIGLQTFNGCFLAA